MEIQWSLVLFTALTGMGGCMFACVAADEFLGRAKAAAFPAACGGAGDRGRWRSGFRDAPVAPRPHHGRAEPPDKSGIFTEALLVGCLCVCVVVYLVLVKREAGAVRPQGRRRHRRGVRRAAERSWRASPT